MCSEAVNQADVEKAVRASTIELIESFRSEPWQYLYESDLQAELFCLIRSKLKGKGLVYTPKHKCKEESYKLGLVYTEYGDRYDIACLDPEQKPNGTYYHPIQVRQHENGMWMLPIFLAIELKFTKLGDAHTVDLLKSDFDKICRNHRFATQRKDSLVSHGLVIGFVQDDSYVDEYFKPGGMRGVEEIHILDHIYVVSPSKLKLYEVDPIERGWGSWK